MKILKSHNIRLMNYKSVGVEFELTNIIYVEELIQIEHISFFVN